MTAAQRHAASAALLGFFAFAAAGLLIDADPLKCSAFGLAGSAIVLAAGLVVSRVSDRILADAEAAETAAAGDEADERPTDSSFSTMVDHAPNTADESVDKESSGV